MKRKLLKELPPELQRRVLGVLDLSLVCTTANRIAFNGVLAFRGLGVWGFKRSV